MREAPDSTHSFPKDDCALRRRNRGREHCGTIDYDYVSGIYDEVRQGDPEMIHQMLIESKIRPDSLVLDVGCGTGNNTLLFTKATKTRVVGVDLSQGMLDKAKEKLQYASFIHCPADRLSFKDGAFDMVYLTEVIHHLSDVESTIKETFRVLKESGTTCIVTQSHKQIKGRMTSRFFPATIAVDQARYPAIKEIEKILRQSGYKTVWSTKREFAPAPLGEDYYDTVSRKGFSMLHKISDEDWSEGLRDLRTALDSGKELSYSAEYTFVWGAVTKRP